MMIVYPTTLMELMNIIDISTMLQTQCLVDHVQRQEDVCQAEDFLYSVLTFSKCPTAQPKLLRLLKIMQ